MIDRNLAAFFADRPREADALRNHLPEGVEESATRSGTSTLRYRGHLLHSAVDPEAEARRLFVGPAARSANLIALMGLGAGHALRALRRETDARILVYEPSLDLLAYALRTLDLTGDPLLRPDAIASDVRSLRMLLPSVHGIGDTIAVAVPPVYRRLFPEEAAAFASELEFFTEQARLSDNTYDLRLRLWIDNLIDNLPQRTRFASAAGIEKRFCGVAGIIVSAGPSLERNVRALAQAEDRALILCTNTAYRTLEAAGVTPHLLVAIEALDVGIQFRGTRRLEGTHALFDGVAHPGLWELPVRGGFVFDDGIPFYQPWLERHFPSTVAWSCGMCVAHAAFSAAVALGCNPIVLVGQDLAHTGGRVYAAGTAFAEMTAHPQGDRVLFAGADAKREIDRMTEARAPGLRTYRGEEPRVRLPGYDGGEVESTFSFAAFKRWFENAAMRHGESRTLLNCTEGGARIEGFAQQPLAEALAKLRAPFDVRATLDEAASAKAVSREQLSAIAAKAARELRAVARATRAGDLARVRALSRDHPLLNGYVRREVREIRALVREHSGPQRALLERRLLEVVGRAALALETKLRRAGARA